MQTTAPPSPIHSSVLLTECTGVKVYAELPSQSIKHITDKQKNNYQVLSSVKSPDLSVYKVTVYKSTHNICTFACTIFNLNFKSVTIFDSDFN